MVNSRDSIRVVKGSALAACVFVFAALCAAQGGGKATGKGQFDPSGTWALDKSKSDFGPFEGTPAARADVTIVVSYVEPELRIKRKETLGERAHEAEYVYWTDGRGESNPAALGRVGVRSQTKWEGNKIVATSTLKREGRDGKPVTLETTDKWQLSSDGKVLTQTTTMVYGGGERTVKQVYRRVG